MSLSRVLSLCGLLGGTPPGLVLAVPLDGGRQAIGKVGMPRLPTELAPQLGGIDGVAAIVAGSVADPVEGILGLAHRVKDLAQDGDVVLFAIRADEVSLSVATFGENFPHRGAVILSVNPVADVLAVSVELGTDSAQDVGDLARNELLHVLVGTVVVGAVGNRGAQTVGTGPGADEHV